MDQDEKPNRGRFDGSVLRIEGGFKPALRIQPCDVENLPLRFKPIAVLVGRPPVAPTNLTISTRQQ
jgi:hypothetical protein